MNRIGVAKPITGVDFAQDNALIGTAYRIAEY